MVWSEDQFCSIYIRVQVKDGPYNCITLKIRVQWPSKWVVILLFSWTKIQQGPRFGDCECLLYGGVLPQLHMNREATNHVMDIFIFNTRMVEWRALFLTIRRRRVFLVLGCPSQYRRRFGACHLVVSKLGSTISRSNGRRCRLQGIFWAGGIFVGKSLGCFSHLCFCSAMHWDSTRTVPEFRLVTV